MRYTTNIRSWSTERSVRIEGFVIELQSTDLLDTRTGVVYADGAYRVLVSGKTFAGKGSSVPFKGETAWSDGARLYDDECTRARWAD